MTKSTRKEKKPPMSSPLSLVKCWLQVYRLSYPESRDAAVDFCWR